MVPLLSATNLQRSYGTLPVLRDINLTIATGEIVSIVGASGAGKSTLLHILGTLDRPDAGQVRLAGQDVFTLNDKQLARFRNEKIGFVFQFNNLLPEFTALENVCLPGFIAGKPEREVRQRAKMLLETLGLPDRTDHFPSQMSGGEQQRTAVARALINPAAISTRTTQKNYTNCFSDFATNLAKPSLSWPTTKCWLTWPIEKWQYVTVWLVRERKWRVKKCWKFSLFMYNFTRIFRFNYILTNAYPLIFSYLLEWWKISTVWKTIHSSFCYIIASKRKVFHNVE